MQNVGSGALQRHLQAQTAKAVAGDASSSGAASAQVQAGPAAAGLATGAAAAAASGASNGVPASGGAPSASTTDRLVEPTTATLMGYRVAAVDMGPLSLLLQGPASGSEAHLAAVLRNLQHLLLFYLGPFARQQGADAEDLLEPVADLVDALLQAYTGDVATLVHGVRRVHTDTAMRQQLDRILSAIEDVSSSRRDER